MTYVPQDGRGENHIGPDGRVTWNIERNDMKNICTRCIAGQHDQCDQRGRNDIVCDCACEVATAGRRLRRGDSLLEDLRQEAIDRAHVEYARGAKEVLVPHEVLSALISRAGKWDDHEQYHAERVDFLPEDTIREGVAENGDPFYQRAKKALEEIGIFERVEVRHDTDILTTSDGYGNTMSAYRSGLDHVVIEIEGYTR